jgi:diguanylate cyclase (GGDEF)-like protein
MSVILSAPVSTDPETIREYVPKKVRDARWWERASDEQKATVIRTIILLRTRGFTMAQVAELRTGVFRMFEELSRQELIDIALHDELTGLPNRHAYELARKKPVVAFADLEGLKWINDNIGHAAGDELLKRTADILDEQGLDAFRLGKAADEFVAQFDAVEEADQAMSCVNEILKRSAIEAAGRVVTGFQLSWGIAADPEAADERLNAAKAALQQAGLRARRGERPVALQEVVKGAAISIAPPPPFEEQSRVNTGRIVNLRQDTLAYPHRVPTRPAIPAAQLRSA